MYYNAINRKRSRTSSEHLRARSFVVTQANAASLQTLIDTHDNVILESGDYTAAGGITLSSNQSIIGFYGGTYLAGHVTIAAGSTNVYVESISFSYNYDLIFEAGAEINNSTFKYIKNTAITLTNGKLEGCRFIDVRRCKVIWDCGTSGYFRNNIFIKYMTQSSYPQTIMTANDTEPSYGNIEIWRNFLITHGDGGLYTGLGNHTMLAIDAESWNYNNFGTKGAMYFRNMGTVKMGSVNAYNNGSYDTLPAIDFEGNSLIGYSLRIENNLSNLSIIGGDASVGTFYSRDQVLKNANGFTLNTMNHLDNEVLIDDVDTTSVVTGATATSVKSLIEVLAGDKVTFDDREYVKDAAGANWATARVGKSDESAAIQALIDTNGVAELEEKVYYISQSLVIDDEQGIVGKGVGRTVIIGITDDFPLIEHIADTTGGQVTSVNYTLANLTLQGGETGLYLAKTGSNNFQITFCDFKDLTFKNQTYGIHLDQFYGFDNNFFENVTFDNCTIGLYQYPDPAYPGGDTPEMMYVDKTVFYNCSAVNCGTGFEMIAKRANNTNMWINCYFNNNVNNLQMNNNLNCLFINTTFSNTSGDNVVDGGNVDITAFYGCEIFDNTVNEIFHLRRVYMEDCTVTDNVPMLLSAVDRQLLLSNCNITGALGDVDDGLLINSLVNGDAAFSKKLVKITNSVPTTIIDETSVPYPQILITNNVESPSTFVDSITTYDFDISAHGFTESGLEVAVDAPVTAAFPTTFTAVATPGTVVNGKINRTNQNTPSSHAGNPLIGPITGSRYYLTSEGSGLAEDGVAEAFRYCLLAPRAYSRENGLSMSAKVSLTRITAMSPKIKMYHRPVGGDNTAWALAATSPASLGGTTYVWQDWVEDDVLPPGEPVELLFAFVSETAISTWPDKAFFDCGILDVVITETVDSGIFDDTFDDTFE